MEEVTIKRKKQLLSILPIYVNRQGKWSKIPFDRPVSLPLGTSRKVQVGNSFYPKYINSIPSQPAYIAFNIIQLQAIILLLVIAGCLFAIPYFLIISDWAASLFTFLILLITLRFIYNSIEISPE